MLNQLLFYKYFLISNRNYIYVRIFNFNSGFKYILNILNACKNLYVHVALIYKSVKKIYLYFFYCYIQRELHSDNRTDFSDKIVFLCSIFNLRQVFILIYHYPNHVNAERLHFTI